ncbi:MAG: hypothetical protein ABIJ92_04035 [Candidatus Aenigmatarchaeota archaeon]
MGLEELLVKNSGLIFKLIEIAEGKEVTATLNLDGVEFDIADTSISLKGEIEFTVNKKKKKK